METPDSWFFETHDKLSMLHILSREGRTSVIRAISQKYPKIMETMIYREDIIGRTALDLCDPSDTELESVLKDLMRTMCRAGEDEFAFVSCSFTIIRI